MKKVLLVGLGRMGKNHLRVLKESSQFTLVGIVDPEASDSNPQFSGQKLFKSLDAVGSFDYDTAVVAAPTQYHYDIAKYFLERKKPLLLEKPVASTLQQGEELVKLAQKNGTPFFVGHLERLNPAVRKLKEVIQNGWIGDPIHYNFTRVGGYPGNVKAGNNVLLDLAVHDLDVLEFLSGSYDVQSSICHSTWQKGIYDTADILLKSKTQNGSASIHVNWITPTKIRTLRVTGTRGVCFVDYMLQTCTLYGGNLLQNRPEPEINFDALQESYKNSDRIEFGVNKEEPLKIQLQEFHLALSQKPSQICSGEQALKALTLAEEALTRRNHS